MRLWTLLACAGAPKDSDTALTDAALVEVLAAPGPWAVGYRERDLTYPDPSGAGDRTLRLALWYPTDAKTGEDVSPRSLYQADDVLGEAEPAAGPWPLVLFSHGHQGYAENSSFLMEHLASHGVLVAAPDHTGNTTFDGSDRTTEIYYQRPRDLGAVLDHLQGGGEPGLTPSDDPIVALGHSFGGYTVFALAGSDYDLETWSTACTSGADTSSFCSTWSAEAEAIFAAGLRDDRVAAALAMAPGDYDLFGAAGAAGVDVPMLVSTGDLDGGTAGGGALYWDAIAGGDHRYLQITGAGHQAFTDFSGVSGLDTSTIDPELGFRILDVYTLAWVRAAWGDGSVAGILDGDVRVAEEASVE